MIDYRDIENALSKEDDLSFFRALALAVNANDGDKVIKLLKSNEEITLTNDELGLCEKQEEYVFEEFICALEAA
jgi:hypothetical protein